MSDLCMHLGLECDRIGCGCGCDRCMQVRATIETAEAERLAAEADMIEGLE